MKKIRKNIMQVLFVFALGIGMFGLSAAAFAAGAKGPNAGQDSFAYVKIYQNKTNIVLYGSKNYLSATSSKAGKIKGAVYSKKTNTLTLNNFNHPTYNIEVNEMGSDFKLVIKGKKNSVQSIRVWGYYYGGSLAISGKGTLKVNANKKSPDGHGIHLNAEYTPSVLTIAKDTTVKAWRSKTSDGKKGYPFFVEGTTKSSKGITSKGKLSGKVKKTYHPESKKLYNYCINANTVTSKK